MTYNELKHKKELILLDCISGSTAYNLNIQGSDVDKKGIFIMPLNNYMDLTSKTR
jgi:predicted nucleotidyltransferase